MCMRDVGDPQSEMTMVAVVLPPNPNQFSEYFGASTWYQGWLNPAKS